MFVIFRVDEDLDEYENDELDEYEDFEGDEYGYAEDEEAEVEEEDPIPKKEVQDYLELRQKLKEAARKKLAKQSGSGSNSRDNKRSKLENFGSFFGPSRPVIAERVIQESKSFLETRQELPRLPSSQSDSRRAQVSGKSAPRNGMAERRPHNPVKMKVQKLKDTRDYSFLLSDDADVPKAANVTPNRSNSAAVSVQGPSKSKDFGHAGRQIPNGTGERRPVASNSHTRRGQNSLHQKPSPSIRPDSRRPERLAVPEHKKNNPVSGHGNGTGQPLLPKREPHPMKKAPGQLERKVAGASKERKILSSASSTVRNPSASVTKVAMPNMQRSHILKPQTLSVRQQSEERMIQTSKGKILPRQTSSSLKPQMKAPKQIPPRYSREDSSYRSKPLPQKPQPKPKPKPVRRFPDQEDDGQQAILEIRKMFGYNPNRYAGDDDDLSDMEADFRTIQMEEKRSARIAREEDERELMLIQEEEERENQRKLAKKRKMGQR
ncbi:hypothetical protein V2J09_011049 [Rumex salicifolius]